MPRYVILWHECPPGYERGSHWDFMLERDGVLRTWSLPNEPGADTRINGEALADHRLAYLDYSGPVSGGRGTVTPWDAGTYESVADSDTEWTVELAGGKLPRRVVLTQRQDEPQRWELVFSGA